MLAAQPQLLEAWENVKALGLAALVHVLAAVLIVLGTRDWKPFKPPVITGMTIEAVMVDTQALIERREAEQREARQAEQREQAREQRQRELQAQAERERQAAAQQERERKAAEEQAARQEAERKRQAELRLNELRERQQREREEKIAQQQAELEALQKQRAEAERQRRIEEERLKQLAARRESEAAAKQQAEAEAAMRAQMEAEEAAGGPARWVTCKASTSAPSRCRSPTTGCARPPPSRACVAQLSIVQIPGGEVISAAIKGACNADEATRRSLIAAVERAGSLPYRGFEDVFVREIDFIFTYDGD